MYQACMLCAVVSTKRCSTNSAEQAHKCNLWQAPSAASQVLTLVDFVHHSEGRHSHALRKDASEGSEFRRLVKTQNTRLGRGERSGNASNMPAPTGVPTRNKGGLACSSMRYRMVDTERSLLFKSVRTAMPAGETDEQRPKACLQRDQVQNGGHRALAAALPVGVQRLQLLAVPELDPANQQVQQNNACLYWELPGRQPASAAPCCPGT